MRWKQIPFAVIRKKYIYDMGFPVPEIASIMYQLL
jgi:hypothetical protein